MSLVVLVPPSPGLLEADIGVLAEATRVCFATKPVFVPPQLAPIWAHDHVKPPGVAELVRLLLELRVPNGGISECHLGVHQGVQRHKKR